MVFFTVLVSVLLQGMTIPAMARRLGVAAPPAKAAAAATPVFSQIEARLREAAEKRSRPSA